VPGLTKACRSGSWVVRHLVTHYPAYRVVCLDKLEYCASLRNLASVAEHPNFHFCQADITDAVAVRDVLSRFGVDAVLHLAAQSHVDLSFGNSFSFTYANVFGTHVLLEAAKEHRVRLFIHASTDEVYGSVDQGAADLLETSILSPTNPYAASKAAAEMLVNAYYKSFNLPVIIVRCNNVYGPHQYPEKIIPKFICLLLRNQKLILHGDGSPTRRYLYGGDAADAFDFVLSKGVVGQTYNVGSEDEVSNIDLCRTLLRTFDRPVDDEAHLRAAITFVRDRPFNDHRYAIDGSKLKALGWRQSIPLSEGLPATVHWYREHSKDWWGPLDDVLTAFPVEIQADARGRHELRAQQAER